MARSTASSGLLLDVSKMLDIKVSESFTATEEGVTSLPRGKKANVIVPKPGSNPVVSFGPGWNTIQLNRAIQGSKIFTQGAAHDSVTVAEGWAQMGDHGPLARQYGIGSDQFLEVKVVTADGQLKIANAVSNTDLIWALRGGGGGTFGIVVEATMKAHHDIPITVHSWWINSTSASLTNILGLGNGDVGLDNAIGYVMQHLPSIWDTGASGYYYPGNKEFRGYTLFPGNLSSPAKANAIWRPILEKIQSFPGMTKYQSKVREYPSYYSFYSDVYGHDEDTQMRRLGRRHGPGEMAKPAANKGLFPIDGHWLTTKHFSDPQLMTKLKPTRRLWSVMMTSPGTAAGNGSDVSAHPGWRRTMGSILGGKVMGQFGMDNLREWVPETGTYGNEALCNEPNWQNMFWGPNYPRLFKIKTKYDPDMVFWVTPGINAEFREVRGGRVCTVAKAKSLTYTKTAPSTDNVTPANILNPEALFGNVDKGTRFPAPGTFVGTQEDKS